HVVDLATSRRAIELVKRLNQIGAMNVVPDLFGLVAEDLVLLAAHNALHEIGEKSMKLRARMVGSGETSTAETSRLHAEISSVFLHQHVGRELRHAKKAVQ